MSLYSLGMIHVFMTAGPDEGEWGEAFRDTPWQGSRGLIHLLYTSFLYYACFGNGTIISTGVLINETVSTNN